MSTHGTTASPGFADRSADGAGGRSEKARVHHTASRNFRSVQSYLGHRDAASWMTLGQGLFVLLIALCFWLAPSQLAVKRGLSFYGTDVKTIIPYAGAFVVAITFSTVGLRRMKPGQSARSLCRAIGTVIALMVPIPLTPYSLGVEFDWLHIGAAVVLFSAGLILSIWLVFRFLRRVFAKAMLGLNVAAAIAILTAQVGLQNYMLPSELVFQFATTSLIAQALRAPNSALAPSGVE